MLLFLTFQETPASQGDTFQGNKDLFESDIQRKKLRAEIMAHFTTRSVEAASPQTLSVVLGETRPQLGSDHW